MTKGVQVPIQVVLPGLWCGRDFWEVLRTMARQPSDRWRVLEVPWLFDATARPGWRFSEEIAAYETQMADLMREQVPVVLIGHSYGAQHALELLARGRLNVQGVVVLTPAAGFGWWFASGWRLARFLLRSVWMGDWRANIVVNQQEMPLARTFMQQLQRRRSGVPQRRALLAQVVAGARQSLSAYSLKLPTRRRVPALVVWSEGDRLLPAGRVPQGMTEIRLQEDGHFMFLAQRETWARIDRWLVTLGRERARQAMKTEPIKTQKRAR